jgi:hypothetical protein
VTPPPAISRRALLGTGGLLLAGGLGVAVGVLRPPDPQGRPEAPPWLIAAVEREQSLLAGVDSALAAGGDDPTLAALRADHAAHAETLQAALAVYPVGDSPRSTTVAGTPTRTELRAAERTAAQAGLVSSIGLSGGDAALLASIAACEATHAELLR